MVAFYIKLDMGLRIPFPQLFSGLSVVNLHLYIYCFELFQRNDNSWCYLIAATNSLNKVQIKGIKFCFCDTKFMSPVLVSSNNFSGESTNVCLT